MTNVWEHMKFAMWKSKVALPSEDIDDSSVVF